MSRRIHERLRSALAVIACAAALGCGERSPTGASIGEVSLAKGGGGGGGSGGPTPIVNSTDPSAAPQDVRLNVRVLGANYNSGSTVRFLLNGRGTATVVVNGTQFVSASELVADVSISADALVDLYDVEVTALGGKKGIGVEKFAVTGPTIAIVPASVGSPTGLYGDGGGLYEGGFLSNSQQNGVSNGNFNMRPDCGGGRSIERRLPASWVYSGSALNCDGPDNDVLVHIPGLLFANGTCPAPGCAIGGVPVVKGGFGPTVNTYFNVNTDADGRYDDGGFNVVWTNAVYNVLRRATDGSPCTWRVTGSTADFHRAADRVRLFSNGAMALDVTVNRDDGLCG
jgi:hypothetical protein